MHFPFHVNSTPAARIAYLFLLISLPVITSFQKKDTQVGISKSGQLANPLKAEVIGIQDGDTIELKFVFTGQKAGHRTGKPLRIRLLHVNCPEKGQPFYKIAKQFTADRCFRKNVQIIHAGKFDRYGRLLGEVVLPGGNILNKELVKNGYAVHFKKYSTSLEYANMENAAKRKKLGIWSTDPLHFGKI